MGISDIRQVFGNYVYALLGPPPVQQAFAAADDQNPDPRQFAKPDPATLFAAELRKAGVGKGITGFDEPDLMVMESQETLSSLFPGPAKAVRKSANAVIGGLAMLTAVSAIPVSEARANSELQRAETLLNKAQRTLVEAKAGPYEGQGCEQIEKQAPAKTPLQEAEDTLQRVKEALDEARKHPVTQEQKSSLLMLRQGMFGNQGQPMTDQQKETARKLAEAWITLLQTDRAAPEKNHKTETQAPENCSLKDGPALW